MTTPCSSTTGATMMISERPNSRCGRARLSARKGCHMALMPPGPAPAHSRRRAPSGCRAAAWDLPRSCACSRVTCTSIERSRATPSRVHRSARLKGRPAWAANSLQQRGFRRRQPHRLALAAQFAALGIEHRVAHLHGSRRRRGRRRRGAAHQRAAAQDQLARLERLGQVIVGAVLETGDAVLAARRARSGSGSGPANGSRTDLVSSRPVSPGIITSTIRRSKAMDFIRVAGLGGIGRDAERESRCR